MNTANTKQCGKLSLSECVRFTCSQKHAYVALGYVITHHHRHNFL